MASNCASWTLLVLILWTLLCVQTPTAEAGERNSRFVKIDVSKINVKNATDPGGNGTSTTTTTEPPTEPSSTPSTTEGTTTTVASTTVNTTPTESTTTVETSTSSSSTTGATPATAPTDSSFPPLKAGRSAKLIPKGYYCRCDLTINVCDINCCCDIDCDETILRTFVCDEEELHADEYHHDAGLQSCRVQGGLFCLVEPVYEEGDDSFYNPKRLPEASRNRWQEVFPLDSSPTSEEMRDDHYRVDDVLYFYNESSELVQPLALPYSLIGSACQVEQPVRFLRDRSDLCRRTVNELSDFNRVFLRHHASTRFFRTPKKSTVMEHYCVEDADCVNATLSVCRLSSGDVWNCTQASNSSDSSMDDTLDGDTETICRELEVAFTHNYTNLLAARMKLLCLPYSDGELWEERVWQRVVVKFQVAGPKRSNTTRAISGNIGYLIGKPLIVTHLELPPNGTTGEGDTPAEVPANPMLAYFTNGTRLPDASFRLRVPVSRKNRCVLTERDHGTIDFGVDSHHRCTFVPSDLTNLTTEGSQNYTRLCQDLQAGLYSQLLHGVHRMPTSGVEGYDRLNLFVSKYANPINRTADWFRVRSTNVILDAQPGSEAPSNTDGTDSYFTCSNMLINVDFRFYYARVRVRDVRHQAIVQDAEIVFGPRVNLRFRLDEDIRVPIFVQVQFFDLTSSSSMADVNSSARPFLTGFCVCLIFMLSTNER